MPPAPLNAGGRGGGDGDGLLGAVVLPGLRSPNLRLRAAAAELLAAACGVEGLLPPDAQQLLLQGLLPPAPLTQPWGGAATQAAPAAPAGSALPAATGSALLLPEAAAMWCDVVCALAPRPEVGEGGRVGGRACRTNGGQGGREIGREGGRQGAQSGVHQVPA